MESVEFILRNARSNCNVENCRKEGKFAKRVYEVPHFILKYFIISSSPHKS